jgi:hypothetical protein
LTPAKSTPEIAARGETSAAPYPHSRRVVDRSVLGPLYAYYAADPPPLSLLDSMVAAWRRRVDELAEAGWSKASGEKVRARMLACRPCDFGAEAKWHCRVSAACPMCHGLEASAQWSHVDSILFPPGGGLDYSLFLRERVLAVGLGRDRLAAVLKNWLGGARDGAAARRGFVSRDMDHRSLAPKHVTGGLASVVVALRSAKGVPASWRVKARQLLVVEPPDPGFDKDADLTRKGFLVESARVSAVPRSRTGLAEAVAWVMAYPKFLLSGPTGPALDYLEARQGRRLTTRFGTLYGPGHA